MRTIGLVLACCVGLGAAVARAQDQAPPPNPPPPGYAPPPNAPPPGYAYPPPPPPQNYYPPPPPGAYAPAERPGRHTHDGLFVRPHTGAGRLAMSESDGANSLSAHGTAVSFGIALGYAVVENVVIYGDLYFMSADNPTLMLNGMSAGSDGVSMFLGGFGPGIAYFIQPVNIYLSASVGAAKLQLHDTTTNDLIASTEWGWGTNAVVGKEWWVSDNWGLGAALQFHYGSMQDGPSAPSAPRVHSNGIALLFSSTFN